METNKSKMFNTSELKRVLKKIEEILMIPIPCEIGGKVYPREQLEQERDRIKSLIAQREVVKLYDNKTK